MGKVRFASVSQRLKRFSSRFLSGLPKRLMRKRAAFGIDAAIMIGFILAMMFVLAVAGPTILQWLAGDLMGGSKGAYSLLIELPTWDPSKSPTKPPSGASAAQWVGYAAHQMYGVLQPVALGLLSIVLVIAAMCYIMETFRIMGEGTAINIIMNSAFSLIIIFAIPYIYNGVAAAINAFTGWPEVGGTGLIIKSGSEIDALINAMGGGVLGWGDFYKKFFGSVVIFIIATSILILAVLMGAARLLIIGCLAAALPLLIMLRLIPPVKHLADSLIETVIGIMFASIIAAIMIHFGSMLVPDEVGLSGMVKLVIALATFAGAAYMSTMFAGRLGGLFTAMGAMASMASSTATGLMLAGVATGTGMVTGGLVGLGAAATQAGRQGVGLGVKGALGAFLRGAGAGGGTMLAATLPGAAFGVSPGKVMTSAAGAFPVATAKSASATKDVLLSKSGSIAESLIDQWSAEPVPGESVGLGNKWFEENIEGKSDRAIGEYFANKLELEFKDPEKAGAEIRKKLASLKGAPQPALYRIMHGLEGFKSKPEDEKFATKKTALIYKDENAKRAKEVFGKAYYDPKLEEQDVPVAGYYAGIFRSPTLGKHGEEAKARILALMRQNFEENKAKPLEQGGLSADEGYKFAQELLYKKDESGILRRRTDEEVGAVISHEFGISVPREKYAELGHHAKDFLETLSKYEEGCLLLDNLRIVHGRARESLPKTDVRSSLEHLGANEEWLSDQLKGELRKYVPKGKAPASEVSLKDFFDGDGDGGSSPPPPPTPPKKKRGKQYDIYDPELHNMYKGEESGS